MTVLLVVLGRNVRQLEFLAVLLGDAPVLPPHVATYQRLLAHDDEEAIEIIRTSASSKNYDRVYDDVLVPALNLLKQDRKRGNVAASDEADVLDSMETMVKQLNLGDAAQKEEAGKKPNGQVKTRVLLCPAHDRADQIAVEMLHSLLNGSDGVASVSVETLGAELLDRVDDLGPAIVCIGSLAPGGLDHTRYLCKRLRSRYPDLKIVVGHWGTAAQEEAKFAEFAKAAKKAGADMVTATLRQTRDELRAWLMVLERNQEGRNHVETSRPLAAAGH